MLDLDVRHIIGRPEEKELDKGAVALVLLHLIDHIPPCEPEAGHLDVLRPFEKMPEKESADRPCQILEGVKFSLLEDTEDDIVSLLRLLKELHDLVGMILQVVIHSDDKISVHIVKTGHDRGVLPEISGQIHSFYIAVFLTHAGDSAERIVL